MRSTLAATALAAVTLAVMLVPAVASATANQLHGGPTIGFIASSGPSGGFGGAVGFNGGYGLNDSFRLYANLEYGLSVGATDAASPRHSGSASFGVAYVLDVVSVLPWFGLGLQGNLVGTPQWLGVLPAVEGRIGFDFLTSRTFGLTLQVAYGFVLLNREQVGDTLSAVFGMRFTTDL